MTSPGGGIGGTFSTFAGDGGLGGAAGDFIFSLPSGAPTALSLLRRAAAQARTGRRFLPAVASASGAGGFGWAAGGAAGCFFAFSCCWRAVPSRDVTGGSISLGCCLARFSGVLAGLVEGVRLRMVRLTVAVRGDRPTTMLIRHWSGVLYVLLDLRERERKTVCNQSPHFRHVRHVTYLCAVDSALDCFSFVLPRCCCCCCACWRRYRLTFCTISRTSASSSSSEEANSDESLSRWAAAVDADAGANATFTATAFPARSDVTGGCFMRTVRFFAVVRGDFVLMAMVAVAAPTPGSVFLALLVGLRLPAYFGSACSRFCLSFSTSAIRLRTSSWWIASRTCWSKLDQLIERMRFHSSSAPGSTLRFWADGCAGAADSSVGWAGSAVGVGSAFSTTCCCSIAPISAYAWASGFESSGGAAASTSWLAFASGSSVSTGRLCSVAGVLSEPTISVRISTFWPIVTSSCWYASVMGGRQLSTTLPSLSFTTYSNIGWTSTYSRTTSCRLRSGAVRYMQPRGHRRMWGRNGLALENSSATCARRCSIR
uniref:Uncharacterized protein n=1 Tax=Anopheles coluzzii TaxID=1518534 RepID=A0A8W7PVB7_ANOCL